MPVVLWVGVEPGSLTSEKGLEIANGCQAELVKAGVIDVHCEIRETNVTCSAIPTKAFHDCHVGGEDHLTLTSTLGQSVAAEKAPGREGTLTCFLSLIKERGQQKVKAALMSRHVALKGDSWQDNYKAGTGAPKQYVLMPGETSLGNVCEQVKKTAQFWESYGQNPIEEQRVKDFNSYLKTLKTPTSRRIGHILCSPARTPDNPHGSPNFLPDYALVKLDATWFGDNYDNLTNVVYIGDIGRATLGKLNHGFFVPESQFIPPTDGLLQLEHVIPIGEIKCPTSKDELIDEFQLRVGKRGRSTGLT